MTLPDPREQPFLNLWPDAGTFLKLSRPSTYKAAERGEIATVRIGRRVVVPTAWLLHLAQLEEAMPETADP